MGALSYVDGVHATPHGPIDVRALGADFYATSAYKWSGPHIGGGGRRPGACSRRCARTSSAAPGRRCRSGSSTAPRRSPTWPGSPRRSTTWPRSAVAAAGTRRERVLASMTAVARPRAGAVRRCCSAAWRPCPQVTHVRQGAAGGPPPPTSRSPGTTPAEVAEHLAGRRVNVWNGHNYAWELTGVLGIRDAGSAVRAGPGPLQRPLRRGPAAGRGGRAGGLASPPGWPLGGLADGVPVDPGAARHETDPLVETAGGLPRRPRGQVHGSGAGLSAKSSAFLVSACPMPRPLAVSSTITSSIQARKPVGIGNIASVSEADDPPVQPRDQQRDRLRPDDALHRRLVGLRRAAGQLRQQVAHGRRRLRRLPRVPLQR